MATSSSPQQSGQGVQSQQSGGRSQTAGTKPGGQQAGPQSQQARQTQHGQQSQQTEQGSSRLGNVMSNVRESATHLKDQAGEQLSRGTQHVTGMVNEHPLSSVLLAFSVGFAVGAVLEMMLFGSHEQRTPRSRLRNMWDTGYETVSDAWDDVRHRVQKGLSR